MGNVTLAVMAILLLTGCQGQGRMTGADDGGGPESIDASVGGNVAAPGDQATNAQ